MRMPLTVIVCYRPKPGKQAPLFEWKSQGAIDEAHSNPAGASCRPSSANGQSIAIAGNR